MSQAQTAEEGLMSLLEAMLTLASREAMRPKPPPVKPGGYAEDHFLDLTEDEKEEFSCQICYQIIKESMQCVNNHKFCRSCLLVWSTTGQYANRIKCPVCRTNGYYFPDHNLDERIGQKKVKCHLESCTWTGNCKQLLSHRHTNYGDDKPDDGDDSRSSSVTMPRLSQAPPIVPSGAGSRFAGTGLTTRDTGDTARNRFMNLQPSQDTVDPHRETPRGLTSLARARASPSSLSTTSQETIVEIPQTGSTRVLSGPRRIPPVRSSGNNRIVFNHTRPPPRDGNNNVRPEPSAVSSSESSETVASSIASGFTPRPPSAPRTNTVNTRRLPRITNPPPLRRRPPPESASLTSTASSATPAAQATPARDLGDIRDRLSESRLRLDNLMTSFTGELDRNRQEMADFQQERERHRQEQLEEVRGLGQRLSQVASELRRLLEHRRGMGASTLSDSDEDEE